MERFLFLSTMLPSLLFNTLFLFDIFIRYCIKDKKIDIAVVVVGL